MSDDFKAEIVTTRSVEVRDSSGTRSEVIGGGIKGEKGEKGDTGEQGPPGLPGSAPQAYIHYQSEASATWVIDHELGFNPSTWRVEDSAGTDHEPADIEDVDINTTILYFAFPFGGTAKGS